MTSSGLASVIHLGAFPLGTNSRWLLPCCKRCLRSFTAIRNALETNEQLLVVVGGGAAGIYASIRAKNIAAHLNVMVIEEGKLLSKVKISGGGRCNVTNGHFVDSMRLTENYPRGNKELRGSFFNIHGPQDTMCWFFNHGVQLKTEEDGRVFPVSNTSASIVDCLLSEANRSGVSLQTGKVVSGASVVDNGKFLLKVEKRTVDFVEYIEADYVLVATGSSRQGYKIAVQLGHSIVDPVPSLFTFKIEDIQLASLSGVKFIPENIDGRTDMDAYVVDYTPYWTVAFPRVKAKLKLEKSTKSIPEFTQVGPMLVTHWGLSGPVILRLSAWAARELFLSNYTGMLSVDFTPDIHIDDLKRILFQHKAQLAKHKACNSFPSQFGLVKRFWRYLLEREGLDGDILWASISNNHLSSLALLLKQCPFKVVGKVSLDTMESKIRTNLFFAGEVLNIDGITGGFNFQNAWTGGYIAGTNIGERASSNLLRKKVL